MDNNNESLNITGINSEGQKYTLNIAPGLRTLEELIKSGGKEDALKILIKLKKLCSPKNDILANIDKIKRRLYHANFMTMNIKDDILSLENEIISKEDDYKSIKDKFIDLYKNLEKNSGISFLCPELDKRTGGIAKGTVCSIIGGPGSMKTTTAINIAYNAMKEGKNICYLSLEEQPLTLYLKLLSRVSVDINKKILVSDILKKNLGEDDENSLYNDVYSHLNSFKGCFHIIGEQDIPSYKASDIENKIKQINEAIKKEYKEKNDSETDGIDILIVDHIQLLKYGEDTLDEFALLNRYVSFFRKQSLNFLNKKREIVVILLSQVNREGIAYAQKHNGEYKMQHLAEASEIERASSYIISVYTDPMSQVSKLLKMGAVKLRGASLPLDTINVFADGEYYQVGDTNQPEQSEYNMDDVYNANYNSFIEDTINNEELEKLLQQLQ